MSLYLTIDEASATYGVHRVTLYDLIKRHDLTIYRRPGDRHSYVKRADLEALFQFTPVKGPEAIQNRMRASVGLITQPKGTATTRKGKTN